MTRRESFVYAADFDSSADWIASLSVKRSDDHGDHKMIELVAADQHTEIEMIVSAQHLLEAVAKAAGWEVGPYLDQAECAELVGLSLSSFKSYRSARNESFGFPEPDRKFGSHPVWLLSTVERFIRSRVNNGVDRTPQDVRE